MDILTTVTAGTNTPHQTPLLSDNRILTISTAIDASSASAINTVCAERASITSVDSITSTSTPPALANTPSSAVIDTLDASLLSTIMADNESSMLTANPIFNTSPLDIGDSLPSAEATPSTITDFSSSQPKTNARSIDLDERIRKLLQELQDEILHFTLLATLPVPRTLQWDATLERHQLLPPLSEGSQPQCSAHTWSRLQRLKCYSDLNGSCWIAEDYNRSCFAAKGHCMCNVLVRQCNANACLSRAVILIDEHYKPPTAIQIDRKTRTTMSEIVYMSAAFVVQGYRGGRPVLSDWLRSLPKEYRKVADVFVLAYPNT